MNLRQQIKTSAIQSALKLADSIPTNTLGRTKQQMDEFAVTGYNADDYDIWLGEFIQVRNSIAQLSNQTTPSEVAAEQAKQKASQSAAEQLK